MKGLLCVITFLLFSCVVFGEQVTAYWTLDYNGNCSNSAGPVTGYPVVRANPAPIPMVTYSSKGVGSNTWNSSSLNTASYYQYKLTATDEITLEYCQIKMESTSQYLHSAIRYSLDNFNTYSTMLTNYSFSGTNPYTYLNNSLSISLTSGQSITVRVYAWGALNASSVFYNQNFWLCGYKTNTTLPVELSSFDAILTSTGDITLNWITQSETNVLGYSVFRNTENIISTANCLTQGLLPATNTTEPHSYSYLDDEVGTEHIIYYYWLQYTEFSGTTILNGPVTIEVNANGTPTVTPNSTSLQSVFPNPFQNSVMVRFGLKNVERVSIEVYNIKGQLVNKLVSATKDAGIYDVSWNGDDLNGTKCRPGIYYVMMNTGSSRTVRKVIKF